MYILENLEAGEEYHVKLYKTSILEITCYSHYLGVFQFILGETMYLFLCMFTSLGPCYM